MRSSSARRLAAAPVAKPLRPRHCTGAAEAAGARFGSSTSGSSRCRSSSRGRIRPSAPGARRRRVRRRRPDLELPDVPRDDQRCVQERARLARLPPRREPPYLTDKVVGLISSAGGTRAPGGEHDGIRRRARCAHSQSCWWSRSRHKTPSTRRAMSSTRRVEMSAAASRRRDRRDLPTAGRADLRLSRFGCETTADAKIERRRLVRGETRSRLWWGAHRSWRWARNSKGFVDPHSAGLCTRRTRPGFQP